MPLKCSTPKCVDWRSQMPKVYAHRGGAGYFVENTIKAFEFAVELGCDGAELDVHLTKDNQVIVHHNDKLNYKFARKSDGSWITPSEEKPIHQLTLAEIQQYTVGEPNPVTHSLEKWPNLLPEENQSIPTLTQVIDLVKQKSSSFELLIEIKTDIFENNQAWMPLVKNVLDIIQQNNFFHRVKFCSFDWNALLFIKQEAPLIPLWFTTHPLSWFKEGDVPKTDIPPRLETLQNIRQAWLSGNAPWYAGHQPTSFEDFPKVIKQLGGEAWFCYHADVTPANLIATHDQPLQLATWSVNLKDADALKKLNLVDALCVDYPKYRFVKVQEELKEHIAKADELRKSKKWAEAEKLYADCLNAYPLVVPVEVYKGITICQRMLKKYEICEKTLNDSLKIFPNHVGLMIEYAALYNNLKKWDKAQLYWEMAYYLVDGNFSELNFNRYFKCLLNTGSKKFIDVFKDALIDGKITNKLDAALYLYMLNQRILERNISEFLVLYKLFKSKNQNLGFKLRFQRKLHDLVLGKQKKYKRHHKLRIYPEDIAVICYAFNIVGDAFSINLNNSIFHLVSLALRTEMHLDTRSARDSQEIVKSSDGVAELILNDLVPKDDIEADIWFILGDVCLLNNNIEAYYLARKNATREVLKVLQSQHMVISDYYLSAMFESTVPLIENKCQEFTESAHCIRGLLANDLDLFREVNKSYIDVGFKEFVKNRTVAIVGPVNVGLENGLEVDMFDIVVKLNFRGVSQTPEIHGSNCHISYYANDVINGDNTDQSILSGMKALSWIVFNGNCNLPIGFDIAYKSKNVFPINKLNPCFKGVLNAIPKAIVDLLLYEPIRIKVFNANLWLSQSNIEGYHVGFKRNEVSRFIWHDPLSNFLFMKRLHENKVFEADCVLEEILSMNEEEYISKLQEFYKKRVN
jgi:glycerophosphoryl diester phosphodiesterase